MCEFSIRNDVDARMCKFNGLKSTRTKKIQTNKCPNQKELICINFS